MSQEAGGGSRDWLKANASVLQALAALAAVAIAVFALLATRDQALFTLRSAQIQTYLIATSAVKDAESAARNAGHCMTFLRKLPSSHRLDQGIPTTDSIELPNGVPPEISRQAWRCLRSRFMEHPPIVLLQFCVDRLSGNGAEIFESETPARPPLTDDCVKKIDLISDVELGSLFSKLKSISREDYRHAVIESSLLLNAVSEQFNILKFAGAGFAWPEEICSSMLFSPDIACFAQAFGGVEGRPSPKPLSPPLSCMRIYMREHNLRYEPRRVRSTGEPRRIICSDAEF